MNSPKLSSITEIKFQNNEEGIPYFPDDILINILSRLPAETVLLCRKVCKRWQSLTSTSYFVELQFKLAESFLFLQQHDYHSSRGWMLVSNDEKLRAVRISDYWMNLIEEPGIRFYLQGSCHGFIYFEGSNRIPCIINPITSEKITLPATYYSENYLCGFFFHPSTMEHRLLYTYQTHMKFPNENHKKQYGYKVFSLETNSWRNLPYLNCYSLSYCDPTMVNGSLYWLKRNLVVRFDVNSEVFDTISCPATNDPPFTNTELLEANGQLYFCSLRKFRASATIILWILVDSSEQHWDEICRIRHMTPGRSSGLTVMQIFNGELLFRCENDELLAYDLQKKIVRSVAIEVYDLRRGTIINFPIAASYPFALRWCKTLSFKKSLVSPKHIISASIVGDGTRKLKQD